MRILSPSEAILKGGEDPDYYYRFQNSQYNGEVQVELRRYPIESRTEKGVWLVTDLFEKKFVCHTWKKKFAHPTFKDAYACFQRRMRIWLRHERERLKLAETINNHFLDSSPEDVCKIEPVRYGPKPLSMYE